MANLNNSKNHGGLPLITQSILGGVNIPWAESLDEQHAIAAVLSDFDDEIDALRLRLAKAQAIKQGMMQQLLTGRTRLAVQE
jgi:type I restriction enzyme S subunit